MVNARNLIKPVYLRQRASDGSMGAKRMCLQIKRSHLPPPIWLGISVLQWMIGAIRDILTE
jgi:hypothetical protein